MERWGEEGEIRNRGSKPEEKEKGLEKKCEHRRETDPLPHPPGLGGIHLEKMRDLGD